MFAMALIVFRETLEAALFIGIVAAATRGQPGRGHWLGAGTVAGLIGALALAAGAEQIGSWAGGVGQDLLNACILALAFAMLAWHSIWASTHGRQMTRDAHCLGRSASSGSRAPWALALAVALAVLREGAETVLFVAGLNGGSSHGAGVVAVAASTGVGAGALVGAVVYLGLSRVPLQRLFAVTNALILLLAASISSQLARTLSQSGLVEAGGATVWDASAVLATDSTLGATLHALMGYDARPSALQLAFYVGALVLITLATQVVRRRQTEPLDRRSIPHALPRA